MNKISIGTIAVAVATSSLSAQWWQASPAAFPSNRSGCAMTGTPQGWGAPTVMYGGIGAGTLDDTWTYNGSTWTALTTNTDVGGVITPNAGPFLARAEMDYETWAGNIILFGGGTYHPLLGMTSKDETWTLNTFSNPPVWAKKFPGVSPPARVDFGGAFQETID